MTNKDKYANTGAGDYEKKIYFQIKMKEGVFIRSDTKEPYHYFSGLLEDIRIRFSQANEEYKIPARFEYELILGARDTDGTVKKFCFQFPYDFGWGRNLVNYLIGIAENHMPYFENKNRYIQFVAKEPKNDSPVGQFFVNISQDRDYDFGPHIKWDKDRGYYSEPVPLPKTKVEGNGFDQKTIRNYAEENQFWMKMMINIIIPVLTGKRAVNPAPAGTKAWDYFNAMVELPSVSSAPSAPGFTPKVHEGVENMNAKIAREREEARQALNKTGFEETDLTDPAVDGFDDLPF